MNLESCQAHGMILDELHAWALCSPTLRQHLTACLGKARRLKSTCFWVYVIPEGSVLRTCAGRGPLHCVINTGKIRKGTGETCTNLRKPVHDFESEDEVPRLYVMTLNRLKQIHANRKPMHPSAKSLFVLRLARL